MWLRTKFSELNGELNLWLYPDALGKLDTEIYIWNPVLRKKQRTGYVVWNPLFCKKIKE